MYGKISSEMEARNLFFLCTIVLLLLFALSNFPYAPPDTPEQFSKNRPFLSQRNPQVLQYPNNPEHNHRHRHSSDVPRHPLDPLTISELNKVRKIIRAYSLFRNEKYALHSVVLEEPEKELVLTWRKGDPLLHRKASVVARVGGVGHVITVDLETSRVITHDEMGHFSGYPTMTIEDMTSSTWAPLANSEFNRTILERGVDLADVVCLPLSTGWFGMFFF